MNQKCIYRPLEGSFDRCLACPHLGNGCSGPRTTAMSFERWLVWIKALKQLRLSQGWRAGNASIAEAVGLSKNTVDNIFSGKQKDVSRTSAGLIEDYLIGGGKDKWPCAIDIQIEQSMVYVDRPETLASLDSKTAEVAELKQLLSNIHASYQDELEKVRSDDQRKIDYLRQQNDRQAAIIDKLLEK